MIKIKRHTEGDSRVATEVPTFEAFDRANRAHVSDVQNLVYWFAKELRGRTARHDWTKVEEPYRSMFYRDLCGVLEGRMDFFDGEWSKLHYEVLERHHLNRRCPEDVNLFDVIEMLCDCVAAGIARNGDFYDLEIPSDVLQKAVNNTTQLLKEQCEVD